MDDEVVGFKDVEVSIIEDLTRGSTERQMVAIVGMPGQGKTHLAKRIYNSPIVKYHFDIRAWCYISQIYDEKDLLTHILSQVMEFSEKMNEKILDNSDEVLYKSLKGHRYLIVMDDLWDAGAWHALRRSFPDDKKGSRIIFTSRLRDLNLEAYVREIPLRAFSEKESWQLLQRKIFGSGSCPSELWAVGKEIAKNCNGLPLAIVVIAGILARINKKEQYWREVTESQSSYIVGDREGRCMEVIELSYKHLPKYLKKCFLYIGAVLRNNYIPVQKLIRLWVAEGFIQEDKERSLETIAQGYLMDLIARSLIIIAKRGSRGDVKLCRIHDLVLDFCLKKAEDDNFLQLMKKVPASHVPRPVSKQLSRISSNTLDFLSQSKVDSQYLRSLLLFDIPDFSSVSSICRTFKRLRVLDLECTKISGSFPDGIVSLARLRYLAISGCFDSIPGSIENLLKLETFILKGSQKYDLPRTFWNMRKLRHVHINPCAVLRAPSSNAVSRLDNLQTISTLEMRFLHQDEKEEVMKRLACVKSLRCIIVGSYGLPATLSHLESLWVAYSGKGLRRDEFSLPSDLKKWIISKCLKKLTISKYLKKLTISKYLKKLTISKFFLPWDRISVIGKLPELEVLKLVDEAFEGEEWELTEGQFPKLRFLKLKNLDIGKWWASSDYFPPLEQLVIETCQNLKELPDCLAGIATLQKIVATGCSSGLNEIVKSIQEEQLDFGNQQLEVFISSWVAKSLDKESILKSGRTATTGRGPQRSQQPADGRQSAPAMAISRRNSESPILHCDDVFLEKGTSEGVAFE